MNPLSALPVSDVDARVERVLADPAFGTLKRYVIQTTGLSYYEDKDADLAKAVIRATGAGAFRTAHAYLAEISTQGSAALDRLVEELTIGETFFFRHTEMFEALREHVFPDIHTRKKDQRHMRIWSAGCSIGAEPYSLAIMLREELAHLFHDWSIEIIGTDINRRFLRLAREGAYESWALRGMPDEKLRRYFDRDGKKWVLKCRFKEGVTFQHHNLVRDRFPSLGNHLFALDIAICRNVMIYFTHETIRQLAEQFHQSLIPGGWLVVGHAEPHTEIFREFHTVNAPGAILYQRRTTENPSPSSVIWPRMQKQQTESRAWHPPIVEIGRRPAEAKHVSPAAPLPGSDAGEEAEACEGLESVQQMADAGELDSALACCEHLLERQALSPSVHLFHGLILEQLAAFEAACNALRRAIYLDRMLVLAHFHLGLVQRRLGEESHGIRSLRNALILTDGLAEDGPVRYGDGMTIGDLRSAIAMQLSQKPELPSS